MQHACDSVVYMAHYEFEYRIKTYYKIRSILNYVVFCTT